MKPDRDQDVSPKRQQLEDQVLNALQGEIEPVETSGLYRAALVIVAGAMLLLPLIYFGIVFGLLALIIMLMLKLPQIGGVVFVPAGLLVVLLLFMIKPIFAKRSRHQRPKALRREAEPFIYEYVEWICDVVGAPVPRSIRVDCDVNASASFRTGFGSMFSNDLTLTIGLPLVAGLSLKEFTGILAHEFGHFAQGAGMRMGYVINTTNYWFARVVGERDAWDERLSNLGRMGTRLVVIVWALQIVIWLTRQVLKVLMYMGHMFSCFMSREMEFDADRYATRLVGPKAFESMHDTILELAHAHQAAFSDLGQFWDEGRLADDFPAWVVYRQKTMPEDVRDEIHEFDDRQETGIFDTHPSSKDRIANSYAEEIDGLLKLDKSVPATALFRSYKRLVKVVTVELYRELLEKPVKSEQLFPVEELKERQEAEKEARKALRRYFQVDLYYLRSLPLAENALDPPENPTQTRDLMRQARSRMLDELPSYRKHLKRLDRCEDRWFDAVRASAVLQAGLRINPEEFGIKGRKLDDARDKIRSMRERLDDIDEDLAVFESLAARRLCSAMQLLMLDRVADRIEGGRELREEVRELLPEAEFAADVISHLPTLRLPFIALLMLVMQLDDHSENRKLHDQITQRLETVHRRLKELRADLGNHLYPLDHAREDMTLREYVLPKVPKKDELGELVEVTQSTFSALVTVQNRLFARLALAAEKVESLFGLEPLPEPPEEDDDDD